MDDPPGAGDIVELGSGRSRLPRWRPPGWQLSRGAAVLAVAALAVGLAAGYAAGDRHARGSAPLRAPAATASPHVSPAGVPASTVTDSAPLLQDGNGCSAQAGHEIQLGVQFTNQTSAPLVLHTGRAVPLTAGLKQVAWQWGPCDVFPGGSGQTDQILAAGDTTWLTVTLQVQIRCPWPVPVAFAVGFVLGGRSVTTSLPGFPDLGQVAYSGCGPPNPAETFSAELITPTP
jgi:hypothetical protein